MRFLSAVMTLLLLVNLCVPAVVLGQEEKKPYEIEELEKLIKAGVISDERIIELLYENGLSFYPDDEAIARLKRAGASDEVIEAVRTAEHPPKPITIKEKKPIYKRWWFLGAAALVVGGTVALIATRGGEEKEKALPDFPGPPSTTK